MSNQSCSIKILNIFSFLGQEKALIFQGGVLVDIGLTSSRRNHKTVEVISDEKKKDIEKVLDGQFCNLDVDTQENTCTIQNLKYRVKPRISCGIIRNILQGSLNKNHKPVYVVQWYF